jgi:hypothetical protein
MNGPGPLPTSGSFTYDDSTNQFSSFQVVWEGNAFDLTASANSPFIGNSGPACIGGSTGAQATLLLMTVCAGAPSGWGAVYDQFGNQQFTFEAPLVGHTIIFIERTYLGPATVRIFRRPVTSQLQLTHRNPARSTF